MGMNCSTGYTPPINSTNISSLEVPGPSKDTMYLPLILNIGSIASIVLSSIAFATNTFALAIFLQIRRDDGTLRFLLLLLSANEIVFNAANVSFEVAERRRYATRGVLSSHTAVFNLMTFILTSRIFTDTFLICRNWCVVLIALSRFEVILKPFSRQNGLVLNRRTLLVLHLIILMVAAAAATIYATGHPFWYCKSVPKFGSFNEVKPEPIFEGYWAFTIAFFSLQSLLPPVIVCVVTALMIFLFRRQASRLRGSMAPGRSSNYSTATRGVIILLIFFLIFESFAFFITILFSVSKQLDIPMDMTSSHTRVLLTMFSNLVIVCDSIFNFVAYMLGNTAFRKQVALCPAGGRLRKRNVRSNTLSKSSNITLKRLSFRERVTGQDGSASYTRTCTTTAVE